MAREVFTGYTEVEPDDRIQKTAYHIDLAATEDETSYLYDDKEIGHFTDFTGSSAHLVAHQQSSIVNNCECYCYMLANDLGDGYALYAGNKTVIGLKVGHSQKIKLIEFYNGSGYADEMVSVSESTWYYHKVEKSGTALTDKVYSDTERTVLLDTLSLTLQADHSFRYVYGCNTHNSTHGERTMTLDVEDLDLQEEAPPGVSIPVLMKHYRGLRI